MYLRFIVLVTVIIAITSSQKIIETVHNGEDVRVMDEKGFVRTLIEEYNMETLLAFLHQIEESNWRVGEGAGRCTADEVDTELHEAILNGIRPFYRRIILLLTEMLREKEKKNVQY
jgi:hypothetical protein